MWRQSKRRDGVCSQFVCVRPPFDDSKPVNQFIYLYSLTTFLCPRCIVEAQVLTHLQYAVVLVDSHE